MYVSILEIKLGSLPNMDPKWIRNWLPLSISRAELLWHQKLSGARYYLLGLVSAFFWCQRASGTSIPPVSAALPPPFLLQSLSFSSPFPSPAPFLLQPLSFSSPFPSPAPFLLRSLSFSSRFSSPFSSLL